MDDLNYPTCTILIRWVFFFSNIDMVYDKEYMNKIEEQVHIAEILKAMALLKFNKT